MSVQFGKCNFDDEPVDSAELDRVRSVLAPYGPDQEGIFCKNSVGIIHRAFYTTQESRLEKQPFVTPSGEVITWDGRLDNRSDLIHELTHELHDDSTDLSLVATAYERWGTSCFARLAGDWALSIWNPRERSLILAKDPIGTRHLYYSIGKRQITWSTILDPLVLSAGQSFALCEEYIAGWLAFFPATHLTPYVGILSVPPSCFVLLRSGKHTINKYWDFDPGKKIRHRTDAEYEEHFRHAFDRAVARRLRSDSPILAELSGGMDSSSIVCVADRIIAGGTARPPQLDTLSYYNDSEPNWNERVYFNKVEQLRGREGCHIDIGRQEPFLLGLDTGNFAATPACGGPLTESARQLAEFITLQGTRVVLSGIGGDEVTGGVPTPTLELEDLLVRGRFSTLAHQLKVWALQKRKPWVHLLLETMRGFFSVGLAGVPKHRQPAPWLHRAFIRRNQDALHGYESRLSLFGPLPSFQENLSTLEAVRRQLACSALPSMPTYEKCYPFLDCGLLEFLFAIPRDQIVRPGQRRSLMRRALVGIVPDEIRDRKRKAFVSRTPMVAISRDWAALAEMTQQMICSSLGIIDSKLLIETLRSARYGQEVPIISLMRTMGIEYWLRNMSNLRGFVELGGTAPTFSNRATPIRISAENNQN